MQGITTHIFDVAVGAAAVGIPIRLEHHHEGAWDLVLIAITGSDGCASLLDSDDETKDERLTKGDYRLTFEVAAYFKAQGHKAVYPFVQVTFTVGELRHYSVPLLLTPFGYSTHMGT